MGAVKKEESSKERPDLERELQRQHRRWRESNVILGYAHCQEAGKEGVGSL